MTKIKLCGLTRPADIRAANALRPDFIGFVFWEKSRRFLTPEQAFRLREALDPAIRAVGVFVDESPATVARLLEEGVIDLAQLHGHEDSDYMKALREKTDMPVIKAFRVGSAHDRLSVEAFPSELLLLDAGMGSGATFDWSAVADVKRDFFLAGGLDAGNVALAIRTLHPFGVDVSSGIEREGRKDPQKMAAFVAAVREEDQA